MIPVIGGDDAKKTRMTPMGEVLTTNKILCAQMILNNNVKLWFSVFFVKKKNYTKNIKIM
jgi:hypothetical protein